MSLFDDPLYVPVQKTILSEKDMIISLREGWKNFFGKHPSDDALAILMAQAALETNRGKEINNNNFGNLKRLVGKPFTLFATGENIWNNKKKKTEWHWFTPPHPQTAFRSYKSPISGAKDYIMFLSDRNSSEKWRNEAYKKAFELLKLGKPKDYGYALYKAGYYTANPDKYTTGIIKLYDEFLKKINKLDLNDEKIISDNDKEDILSLIGLTVNTSVKEYFGMKKE